MSAPPTTPTSPLAGFDRDGNPVSVTPRTQGGETVRRPNTRSGRGVLGSISETDVFSHPNSLGWDETNEPPSFVIERGRIGTNRYSTSTQFSVPRMNPDVGDDNPVTRALADLEEVKMVTEDDFEGVDPDDLAKEHLNEKLNEAERLKTAAQGALLTLRDQPDDVFTQENKAASNAAKRCLILFIRSASKELKQREVSTAPIAAVPGVSVISSEPVPRSESVKQFKSDRVRRYGNDAVSSLQNIIKELKVVCAKVPSTDSEFRMSQERFQNISRRITTIKADAKSLLDDAIETGMTDEATQLDAMIRRIKDAELEGDSFIHDAKINLGVVNATSSYSNRDTDLKLPLFSGESGEMDYYTFKLEFEDYVSMKSLTRSQVLRLLTRSCLQGPVKFACRDMQTTEEVFKYLHSNYGNPRLLLSQRLTELRNFGPCQGSNQKKRDWAVTIRSKLHQLHELVRTHDLHDELYFSPVIPELQKSLPYKLLEDFKEELRKKDEAGNVSRKVIFDKFVEYMDMMVNNLTFEINFSLNTGEQEAKLAPKGREISKPVSVKPPSPSFKPPPKKSYPVAAQQQSGRPSKGGHVSTGPPQLVQCPSCPKKHSHVYYCSEFIQSSGPERFKVAAKTRSCFKCLRMDSPVDFNDRNKWEQDHQGHCDTSWVCPQPECIQKDVFKQRHITMCRKHINENLQYEEEFIKSLDQKLIPRGVKFFTFFPQIFNVTVDPVRSPPNPHNYNVLPDVDSPAIFMLQHIVVNERRLMVFYDSGCLGAAINENAAEVLNTTCVRPGPTYMSVAGATTIEIETGDEQFTLLMNDKKTVATLTALRMPEITTPFPTWDLEDVYTDVKNIFEKECSSQPPLPPAPRKIGGSPVDIMLGIRYLAHYPDLIYSLPCGLSVYKSKFSSPNGETAILGGPHPAWKHAGISASTLGTRSFLTAEARAYFIEVSTIHHIYSKPCALLDDEDVEDPLDVDATEFISECRNIHCKKHLEDIGWTASTDWNLVTPSSIFTSSPGRFNDVEGLGSEVTYRCMRCRNCNECRNGELIEKISLKEEAEQFLVEESVTYNPEKKMIEAFLPFIRPPKEHLRSNYHRALKILESQMKLVGKGEQVRLDVLTSHNKLRDKGYVIALDDLPLDVQKLVEEDFDAGYYIPWRTVYKESSISTPVRMVFDASSTTPGGDCLNNILAKGENRLSKILHIILRFRIRPFAFTCDVAMAYNGVNLNKNHYRYQKYLWKEDLLPENPVRTMIIRTLIYGVRPSGNQLAAGLGKLAEYCIQHYPEHADGARVLLEKIYVDDVLNSSDTQEKMEDESKSLLFTLAEAGFSVKAVTYCGHSPAEAVSADLVHVGLVGMVWAPEEDVIGVDIKPLYFGKSKRGKLPELVKGDIRSALSKVFTRRTLVGKVAAVFDPPGLIAPLTSRLKLDLRRISLLGLDWDDSIPEEYLDTWVRNLDDINKAKELRFRRTVIPPNASSLMISIVTSTDASENIAVACVHARVPIVGGGYHVQLLTAKSKLVSTDTIPKAELKGAVMGAGLSYVVRSNLGPRLDSSIYVTDSTIVLYWIHQDQRPLQTGVRNGVIEIRRFSEISRWFHVESELNIADIGTRHCEVEDLGTYSNWQNGPTWMKLDEDDMPIRSIEDITLDGEQKRLAAQGLKSPDLHGVILHSLRSKVADRYSFSNYLVDPNKYNWRRSVRVMGYVIKFIRRIHNTFSPIWKPISPPLFLPNLVDTEPVNPMNLSKEDEEWGENYFYYLGTWEVKHFCSRKEYRDCTVEKGGILFYTSRILDGQSIEDPEETMFDLQPLSFVRPVLDRYSPVSYSIMLHSHNVISKHRNASCTLRESRGVAFILHGRDLSIEIRDGCLSCRRFKARLLEAEMGKVHENRLTIAPAFYLVQVDLFGPYSAVCEHNHRSVVKCYGVVFKDPSTSAIAIYMMQNYSTSAFLQAYTRFSSRYGHPAKMFIDAGSQLVKACQEAEFGIVDVARELSSKYQVGIDYQSCPVGGHNQHGAVERSIRDVKSLLDRVYAGLKLDLISYETCFAWIANELNCFPICIGSRTSNLDHIDLITPSRLLLGRNNRRSLGGYVKIETPTRLMEQMDKVYRSWWNVWKNEKIADYIPHSPLWKTTSEQPSAGDIVIFLKMESEASFGEPVWRIGRIQDVEYSSDGVIRTVVISYKNSNEKTFRSTRRSVRKIAILHHEGDLELIEQLNAASKDAGILFFIRNQNNGVKTE